MSKPYSIHISEIVIKNKSTIANLIPQILTHYGSLMFLLRF